MGKHVKEHKSHTSFFFFGGGGANSKNFPQFS